MQSVTDSWRQNVPVDSTPQTIADAATRIAAARGDMNHKDVAAITVEWCFARSWLKNGQVTYELTHSVAALLAATKSPDIHWSRLPHPFFLIKVPREYMPIPSETRQPDAWVAVAANPNTIIGIADADTFPIVIAGDDLKNEADALATRDKEYIATLHRMTRIVANVVAFLSEHRECVKARASGRRTQSSTFEVVAPSDVHVTREFRQMVAALSCSLDVRQAKSALRHVVRGHWRNQRVGEGRQDQRLVWVRPFMRGDTAAGLSVARTVKISRLGDAP